MAQHQGARWQINDIAWYEVSAITLSDANSDPVLHDLKNAFAR